MLPLWKLALLCSLLTGTSASLLGNLGDDLSNVVDKVKPVLDKGVETVDNTLKGVLEKLKVDLGVLQQSDAWQLAKQKVQEAEKLLNNVVSKLLPTNANILGLKISNSLILDVKAEPTDDGKGLNLRFPVTADVSVTLPIIGQVVKLNASLDLLTAVRIEIDPQTHKPVAVLGECASDPTSISLSLLDGQSQVINKLVNSVINTVKSTVSFLVQKEVSLPFLGAQIQAWRGQVGEFVGLAVSSGHFSFGIENFSLGGQLDPPPLLISLVGSRGGQRPDVS
ncbi:BPI fold-containing family A member 2 isoform X1 [Cebus imitator]|uniref:BPI fold-containing family A member 2 isoform X1 n=1 Tax=Cebus imitator TaxID=2715852 RepID=UPI00189C4F2A|nr:BPI fold-containing family A member 2 isoform X1 [Cebus imitator]